MDLKNKIDSEVSCGYRIKDIHLNCRLSDRQNVSLARTVFSAAVSEMFQKYFPNEPNKQYLADFIGIIDKCFDIFTCRVLFNSVPSKNALGTDLQNQKAVLMR